MSISKDLVAKKLDFLSEQIGKIENAEFNEQEFIQDVDIHDLIVFRLQQAVETCIDIAAHLIAGLNATRKETAKDAFLYLGEKEIIGKELSLRLGKAADFRNRVVHGYNDFDFKLLFKDYKKDVKDLKQFGAEILKYIGSSTQKGFTLIELLIVISIIGILSIIGLVAYTTFLKNARDAKRQSDLKFIQSALEEYHADQHYYPSGTTLGSSITDGKTPPKTYLTTTPKDPKDQSAYSYVASSCDNNSANCASYCLSANIEGTVPLDSTCAPASGFNYAVTRP